MNIPKPTRHSSALCAPDPVAGAPTEQSSKKHKAKRADTKAMLLRATIGSFLERTIKDGFDGTLQHRHFCQSPDFGENIKRGFLRDQWVVCVPNADYVEMRPAAELHGRTLPYSTSEETLLKSISLLKQQASASGAAIRNAYRSLPRRSRWLPDTNEFRQTIRNIVHQLYTTSSKGYGPLLMNAPRLTALSNDINHIEGILALLPGLPEPLLVLRDIPKFHTRVQDEVDSAELMFMTFAGLHIDTDSDSESR